eukprot:scpid99654/ scgid12977/ 
MLPQSYPDPHTIGTFIMDHISQIDDVEDYTDPSTFMRDIMDDGFLDPSYQWGPPMFTANAPCILQIHGPGLMHCHRTSNVDEFIALITGLTKGYILASEIYAYGTGENHDEPDHTVVRVDFKALFRDQPRLVAFDWFSNISLVWNTLSDERRSTFSVESLHIVILLPCTVRQQQ